MLEAGINLTVLSNGTLDEMMRMSDVLKLLM